MNGTLGAGQPAPTTTLLSAVASVDVSIGDTNPVTVAPIFAGLAPTFVDLYQVNVIVPPNLTAKTYPVRVVASKVNPSNAQPLAVKNVP